MLQKLAELGRKMFGWIGRHRIAASVIVLAVLLLAVPIKFAFAGGELFNQFVQNPLDVTAIILAGIIQNITGAIGKLILLLIEAIVIPILGYNGFYNSHITNLGWSLVRDIVNMFVVVVLLVIAIMTIVGYSHANWTQQLPRLFIAIVLVNFSKLICGFLIDISQVIMFTFVNAIVSIAAGNFASMLGLSTFGKFGSEFIDKINESGDGVQAFMFLGGAYLQFIIYLAILAVMFLLAVAFIWRIVVLWILIIMAPLAFFTWGISDVFHSAKSAYTQWMAKFSSALTFGPTLVFFLWLSLAASSGSSLAKTEDFPFPESKNNSDLELESFTLDNFLGMFLALAILIAGMQQAANSAKGMEGFASSMISDKMGMNVLKGLNRPAMALGRRAASSAKSTAISAGGKLGGGVAVPFSGGKKLGLGNLGTGISKMGFNNVGNAISGAGAKLQHAQKDQAKAKRKEGDEALGHYSEIEKNAMRVGAGQVAVGDNRGLKLGQNAMTGRSEKEQMAYRAKFLTDTKEQKAFKEAWKEKYKKDGMKAEDIDKNVQKMFDETMMSNIAFATGPGKDKMQLDDAQKDLLEDVKTANLHLIQPEKDGKIQKETDFASPADYQAARKKAITDHIDKRRADGKFRIGAISDASLKDDTVRSVLGDTKYRTLQKDGKETDVSVLDDLMEGRAGATLKQKSTLKEYKPKPPQISVQDIQTNPGMVANAVRGGGFSGMDRSQPEDSARLDAMRTALPAMIANGDMNEKDHGTASELLLDKGYTPQEVYGDSFPADAAAAASDTVSEDVADRAFATVNASLASAQHFDSVVPETVAGPESANRMTSSIAYGASKTSVRDLQNEMQTETDTTKRAQKRKALSVVNRSVDAELAREQAAVANHQREIETIEEARRTRSREERFAPGGDASRISEADKIAEQNRLDEAKMKKATAERKQKTLRDVKSQFTAGRRYDGEGAGDGARRSAPPNPSDETPPDSPRVDTSRFGPPPGGWPPRDGGDSPTA